MVIWATLYGLAVLMHSDGVWKDIGKSTFVF